MAVVEQRGAALDLEMDMEQRAVVRRRAAVRHLVGATRAAGTRRPRGRQLPAHLRRGPGGVVPGVEASGTLLGGQRGRGPSAEHAGASADGAAARRRRHDRAAAGGRRRGHRGRHGQGAGDLGAQP
eukprot:9708509-Lingulodinium_polyedra.AAC.1